MTDGLVTISISVARTVSVTVVATASFTASVMAPARESLKKTFCPAAVALAATVAALMSSGLPELAPIEPLVDCKTTPPAVIVPLVPVNIPVPAAFVAFKLKLPPAALFMVPLC